MTYILHYLWLPFYRFKKLRHRQDYINDESQELKPRAAEHPGSSAHLDWRQAHKTQTSPGRRGGRPRPFPLPCFLPQLQFGGEQPLHRAVRCEWMKHRYGKHLSGYESTVPSNRKLLLKKKNLHICIDIDIYIAYIYISFQDELWTETSKTSRALHRNPWACSAFTKWDLTEFRETHDMIQTVHCN